MGLGQAQGKGVKAASIGSVHGPLGPSFGPLPWAMRRVGCIPSGVPPISDVLGFVWVCPGPALPFSPSSLSQEPAKPWAT